MAPTECASLGLVAKSINYFRGRPYESDSSLFNFPRKFSVFSQETIAVMNRMS